MGGGINDMIEHSTDYSDTDRPWTVKPVKVVQNSYHHYSDIESGREYHISYKKEHHTCNTVEITMNLRIYKNK